MNIRKIVILLSVLVLPFTVSAKQRTILFIGNSYTFYPMDPSQPGLPFFIEEIAKSIDQNTEVVESCRTIPNANLEFHFNDHDSRKLMEGAYDEVILQGRSTDPLNVPSWFRSNGMPGLASFKTFLPQVLEILSRKNPSITMFVPWGYHPKHEYFKSAAGEFRDAHGDEWRGQTGAEYQRLINRGYVESASGYPVAFSFVGDEWMNLVNQGVVGLDDLYVPNDWSHPSPLGSMIAALVLTRDVFRLDVEKNRFVPTGLDPAQVARIAKALSRMGPTASFNLNKHNR